MKILPSFLVAIIITITLVVVVIVALEAATVVDVAEWGMWVAARKE